MTWGCVAFKSMQSVPDTKQDIPNCTVCSLAIIIISKRSSEKRSLQCSKTFIDNYQKAWMHFCRVSNRIHNVYICRVEVLKKFKTTYLSTVVWCQAKLCRNRWKSITSSVLSYIPCVKPFILSRYHQICRRFNSSIDVVRNWVYFERFSCEETISVRLY